MPALRYFNFQRLLPLLRRRDTAPSAFDSGQAVANLAKLVFYLSFGSAGAILARTPMRPPNLARLRPNERQAVEAFVEALRLELEGRVLLAALFGSKARGDGLPETDIDFLVVTEGDPRELERRISALMSKIDLEHNVLLNALVFSRERWADFARRQAAFWQNVQRDGMVLLRAPRMPEPLVSPGAEPVSRPPDHRPEMSAYMLSAWQALRTAESEFGQGKDYQVVANRAYYAIFYAANALLATEGLQRSKHPGVLALFREMFVKSGKIEPVHLRDYVETMKRRHISDYDLNSILSPDYVRVSLESAQRFTSRVERYLIENGYLG